MRGLAHPCGYVIMEVMKRIKQVAIIGLSIAIFLPISASAMTFTTPSGVVVNEYGNIISMPIEMQLANLQAQIDSLPKKVTPTPKPKPTCKVVARVSGSKLNKAQIANCK